MTQKSGEIAPLLILPRDILRLILQELDAANKLNVRKVCRVLNGLICEPETWKLEKKYHPVIFRKYENLISEVARLKLTETVTKKSYVQTVNGFRDVLARSPFPLEITEVNGDLGVVRNKVLDRAEAEADCDNAAAMVVRRVSLVNRVFAGAFFAIATLGVGILLYIKLHVPFYCDLQDDAFRQQVELVLKIEWALIILFAAAVGFLLKIADFSLLHKYNVRQHYDESLPSSIIQSEDIVLKDALKKIGVKLVYYRDGIAGLLGLITVGIFILNKVLEFSNDNCVSDLSDENKLRCYPMCDESQGTRIAHGYMASKIVELLWYSVPIGLFLSYSLVALTAVLIRRAMSATQSTVNMAKRLRFFNSSDAANDQEELPLLNRVKPRIQINS